MDKYREQPNVLPRAEVFIAAIQSHRARVASLIAATWELSDISLTALEEQEQRSSPVRMSALGRCIYFGELGGALATLAQRGSCSQEDAQAILQQQGLSPRIAVALWEATSKRQDEHQQR